MHLLHTFSLVGLLQLSKLNTPQAIAASDLTHKRQIESKLQEIDFS